jgi:hypothetical protein
VIRFLHAEGQARPRFIVDCVVYTYGDNVMSDSCVVYTYGYNVMSDSCVREWCRKFRDGRTDVHGEGGQVRHSIVTDELVQKVDQCVRGKRRFTILELSEEFPQTSRTTSCRIVTDRLCYQRRAHGLG